MKHFYARMPGTLHDSDARAERIVEQIADNPKLDGLVALGRNFGDAPAVIIVTLPDDSDLIPASLLDGVLGAEGVEFAQGFVRQVPIQPDRGIE